MIDGCVNVLYYDMCIVVETYARCQSTPICYDMIIQSLLEYMSDKMSTRFLLKHVSVVVHQICALY